VAWTPAVARKPGDLTEGLMIFNTASLFLGFGFSFLPNFTPFLAVLVLFA
jgi:hypothetical protein